MGESGSDGLVGQRKFGPAATATTYYQGLLFDVNLRQAVTTLPDLYDGDPTGGRLESKAASLAEPIPLSRCLNRPRK